MHSPEPGGEDVPRKPGVGARMRAAMPCGLMGMLGLMLAVELFLGRHALDFRHIWGWDWHITRKAIAAESPRCELLCVGDSLLKFGLMPSVLEKRLGVRAFNLSLSAGSPPAMYFVFRHAIERGARPKAVLVDLAPHGFAWDVNTNRVVWSELFDARDALDLAWATGDAGAFAETMLGNLLPSIRWRATIRASLLRAVRGEPSGARPLAQLLVRSSRVHRGSFITQSTHDFFGKVDDFSAAFFPTPWKIDPVNLQYTRRLLDLAARERIPVFWLVPPFLAEVHARRAQMGLEQAYTQVLRDFQARYANLTIIDGRFCGYGQDTHNDPLHLNRKGAFAFTTDVAEALAQARNDHDPARWVALPPYREPPPALVAEEPRPPILAGRDRPARRQ